MEIVTMDNEVVKTMMEKIDRIADYVFKKDNVPKEEAEILLTSEEAADLLKISTRTLQRMRKDKTIPYMMARSKCRYRLTDLEECVRRSKRLRDDAKQCKIVLLRYAKALDNIIVIKCN